MSKELRQRNQSHPQKQVVVQGSMFIGPLPPPEIIEEYERIHPGSAKQIMDAFGKQADHRMKIESHVVKGDVFAQRFGVVAGAILLLVALAGGIWLVALGKSLTGFGAFITGVASAWGSFLYSHGRRRKDLEEKAKMLEAKENRDIGSK